MKKKQHKTEKKTPNTVSEPAMTYHSKTATDTWNPNVPFHGTQEEWREHFHQIEEGEFTTWEEHQKKFDTWKKELLANLM